MLQITGKLEIDVCQQNELKPAVELARKYDIPALVVHPSLMADAKIYCERQRGRLQLLVPIDWPKGEAVGLTKLRGLTPQALSADGFEILLTPGRGAAVVEQEIRLLDDFIVRHINSRAEVRWVLGARQRPPEEIDQICAAIRTVRTPAMVRTDHQLKLQVSKANPEAHRAIIERIHQHLAAPVKLSGNFSAARSIALCPGAARYAVSLTQAQQIIRDLQRQPEEVRKMLSPE